MKNISGTFFTLPLLTFPILMTLATASWSLEVELSLSTELMQYESQVYQTSKKISKAIESGSNEEALAEAFIECPADNNPKFQVNFIRLNSVWLMNSKSLEDKQYSGIIHYVLRCKHERRGGDR